MTNNLEAADEKKFINPKYIGLTKTGLPDDIINVWNGLGTAIQLSSMNKAFPTDDPVEVNRRNEEIKNILATRLRTFSEYTVEKYSEDFREKMKELCYRESILAFDALVNAYNDRSTKGEITLEIADEYLAEAIKIVRGE